MNARLMVGKRFFTVVNLLLVYVLVLTACSFGVKTPTVQTVQTPTAAVVASPTGAPEYPGGVPSTGQEQPQETPAAPGGSHKTYLPFAAKAQPPAEGKIFNVQVMTPNVAPFERFEVQFDVQTSASNLDMPYDPNPPAGVQAGIGVSVDVQFTPDNWNTVYTQPAFLYQPYNLIPWDELDHLSPSGPPRWTARFAPDSPGSWKLRILMTDSSGSFTYPDTEFSVSGTSSNPYVQHGFLKVSPTDSRYFQFQDGTPFIGVGFNDGFDNTTEVNAKMDSYEQNKMNFMRVWLSGDGINGSQWTSWASHTLDGDGYLPGVSLDTEVTYNGGDVSLRLDNNSPCLYADFWQGGVPVDPNTTYTVWARVKVSSLSGGDFVIKQGDWLGTGCSSSGTGDPITQRIGNTDWTEISGQYTTGSDQYWLGNLYLAREDSSGGNVYIDEVRMFRSNDPAQANVLREPYANSHEYFDPMNSALWDQYIQSAEQHGVYLKLVIDEKNEWIRNRIQPDGSIGGADNNNFYASAGTKGRWLQEAWWRYLIARWGYSTAVHSFEYINEGDPYNGNHYDAAEAMAKYFDDHDPSHHMVTTSFWSSFPNQEFWSNPNFSHIDYADLHAYISTGWGLIPNLLPGDNRETNSANIRTGNGSATITGNGDSNADFTPRGLTIRGQGNWILKYWMKAEGQGSCSNIRMRWYLDNGSPNGKQGIAPGVNGDSYSTCTTPGGSFGWSEASSAVDKNNNPVSGQYQISLNDDDIHSLLIRIENFGSNGGRVWMDDAYLVSPSGEIVNILGQFDVTALDDDTALYNRAYADVFGGRNLAGALKPLVRGETGIDFEGNQDWNRDLLNDTDGIWLHNNLWGQINSGGMYDLFWWADETIPQSIYDNFFTYRTFMEGIPVSNGRYYDISASTSDSRLRAWGQRDDTSGKMHLWLQNMQHNWKEVVAGQAMDPINGTVTINNVPAGTYYVEWWNAYATSDPVFRTETITSNGSLTLNVNNFKTDVAVKITKQ